MESVATAAIGGAGRAILRGQPVVALEKGFYSIRRQVVTGIEPLGRMTPAAHLFGNSKWRGAFQRLDLVFRVAIRADGRIAMAGSGRFAVDTRRHVARFLIVAGAAGLRLPRKVQRRSR